MQSHNITSIGGQAARQRRWAGVASTALAVAASACLLAAGPAAGSYASEACPDRVTEIQGDDTPAQARSILVGDNNRRAFCVAGDNDWFKLNLTAGRTYRLETRNLAGGADTFLRLFRSDGPNLVHVNEDDDGGGSLSSRIDFKATVSGTYVVQARDWNPNAGSTAATYDLRVSYIDNPPLLTSFVPQAGATGVNRAANLSLQFSEPVQGVSTSTYRVTGPTGVVPATVSRFGTTNSWVLNPTTNLAANTRYNVVVTGGGSAIRDLDGIPLFTTNWYFTTGA